MALRRAEHEATNLGAEALPLDRLGRPPAMTPEKVAYALQLLAEPNRTMTSIAKLLGVSRSTLYNALPGIVPAQRDDQAALQDR
ncbi:helix-turn-helix domain-containing protein [Micromonospora sp. DT62]|uniref:helix-turn-helix domain-containing protein n=1 Tax=Micromonospora sp. DT62 TaxID=3416521 RepID=UPI003CEAB625